MAREYNSQRVKEVGMTLKFMSTSPTASPYPCWLYVGRRNKRNFKTRTRGLWLEICIKNKAAIGWRILCVAEKNINLPEDPENCPSQLCVVWKAVSPSSFSFCWYPLFFVCIGESSHANRGKMHVAHGCKWNKQLQRKEIKYWLNVRQPHSSQNVSNSGIGGIPWCMALSATRSIVSRRGAYSEIVSISVGVRWARYEDNSADLSQGRSLWSLPRPLAIFSRWETDLTRDIIPAYTSKEKERTTSALSLSCDCWKYEPLVLQWPVQ